MPKTGQGQSTVGENKKRLQEIAAMQFGTLSDDEILRFLAERKHSSDLEFENEKAQKEEAVRLERERKEAENLKGIEKKKTAISKKIEELNKSISGEVSDDDLLVLVAKRRELEKVWEELEGGPLLRKEEVLPEPAPLDVASDAFSKQELSQKEKAAEAQAVAPKKEEVSGEGEKEAVLEISPRGLKAHVEEEYGSEKILKDGIEEGSEFYRYFEQLKNNVGSLGELLQEMPLDAKKNKAFMLKVAEIDPAYAMHFADKDTLKKDEDFNVHVASLKNPRNSGNALAEMLPEARTSKVVLTAVKRDYSNIKFIQPAMEDYDEMIDIAKKGALEKVRDLKEAADIMLLIPKPLQQDRQFMLQVKEITAPKKAEQISKQI